MNYLNWQAWFYILADVIMAYWILRWIVIELQLLSARIEANQKSNGFSGKPFIIAFVFIIGVLLIVWLISVIAK